MFHQKAWGNQVRVTSAVRVRFQIIFSVFFFYVFILMAFSEISASLMMSVGNITNIEFFLRALRVWYPLLIAAYWRKFFRPKQPRSFEISFEGKREKNEFGCYLATFLSWKENHTLSPHYNTIVFYLRYLVDATRWLIGGKGKYFRLRLPSPSVFPVYRINGTYTAGMCKLRP